MKEIAQAKAGICKPGKLLIVGPQSHSDATRYLRQSADLAGAPWLETSKDLVESRGEIVTTSAGVHEQFLVRLPNSSNEPCTVKSQLVGAHQVRNASTAVAAALELQKLGYQAISSATIVQGLESATLPGRFQVSKLGAEDPWLVLDGAHTPDSAAVLARTLRRAFPKQPLALVIAMADDKDHSGVMAQLRKAKPVVVIFTTVPIAGSTVRSAPPGMLAGHWQAAGFEDDDDKPFRCRELIQANMLSALEVSQRELFSCPGHGIICVTGSLHAVGAVQGCL